MKGGKKRPSGSEKRQRTELAMVRLTPAEKAIVEEAASDAGLTVASYSRSRILGSNTPPPRSVRRPPVEKELLARVLGQLGKAGSNLNQVARSANIGRDDLYDIRAAIGEVRLAVAAVLAALGRQK